VAQFLDVVRPHYTFMRKTSLPIIAGLVFMVATSFAGEEAVINFSPSPNITFLEDAWSGSKTIKLDFRRTQIADLFDIYRAASVIELHLVLSLS
jgi:hypothetical protein